MCYVCDAERHASRRSFLSLTATSALAGLGLSAVPAFAASGKTVQEFAEMYGMDEAAVKAAVEG